MIHQITVRLSIPASRKNGWTDNSETGTLAFRFDIMKVSKWRHKEQTENES